MKTIVIAAQKGGAGKTTLARNLAVAAFQDGRDVLCLDLDPQGSLRAWWEGRDADGPSMLDREPAPDILRATLNAAQAQFDLCIIDTPPAAPEWLTEVLGAADLVLIPVRPSPDDLRAVGATIAAVNAARVPFAFALSQTPRAKITDEAARVLAQHGRVAPVNIAQRVSYAETGATGKGVTETTDNKAGAEIAAVWDYVKGILHGQKIAVPRWDARHTDPPDRYRHTATRGRASAAQQACSESTQEAGRGKAADARP